MKLFTMAGTVTEYRSNHQNYFFTTKKIKVENTNYIKREKRAT